MSQNLNPHSDGQYRDEFYTNPNEYLWPEEEQFEQEVNTKERARAYDAIISEEKRNVAEDRIRIMEPQTDWQMKRWMYYTLLGFGVFLNLGIAFSLTVILPRWMQLIVVAPISIIISMIAEHSIGLVCAKLGINTDLKRRTERLKKSERNLLGREIATGLIAFQEDREYQTILLFEYLGFVLPLGEVLAIAFCMVLFQPEGDNRWVQFLSTTVLVSPIGALPIMVGMLLCYFQYQPTLRWHIVRSYKRYLGQEDGGPLRGLQHTSENPESPEKTNGKLKETDPKSRRIYMN